MIGALLFGLMVACFFGAGFAAIWRWTSGDLDQGVTLPDPRRVLDDDTARIDPSEFPHDLRRNTRSWTL